MIYRGPFTWNVIKARADVTRLLQSSQFEILVGSHGFRSELLVACPKGKSKLYTLYIDLKDFAQEMLNRCV